MEKGDLINSIWSAQCKLVQKDNKLLQKQNKEFQEEILRLREELDLSKDEVQGLSVKLVELQTELDQWHREAVKANAELGEIKILEGLGLRIDLPCRTGDTVYAYSKFGNRIVSWTVENTIVGQDSVYFDIVWYAHGECEEAIDIELSDFGKTVFITEAEAEEALQKGSTAE